MPTALQRVSGVPRINGVIPALSSEDFDTQPFVSFSATKYLIKVVNPDDSNSQALEMYGAKILTDVSDQVYAKFPDGLNIGVKLLKVASDVTLRISNNENFAVNVTIALTKV